MGQNKGKRPMSHREKMEIIKRQAEEKRLQSKATLLYQPGAQNQGTSQNQPLHKNQVASQNHPLFRKQVAPQDAGLSKRKVVFMPYSAAMWDCMETIWRAAKADLTCETYVVPIPYREKDSTGKINQESYDGEKFPADVEITSYERFSLEREKPDIVYIHNPYDGGNYITSVHPAYYSYNLKRYTRLLIYVPYFSGTTIPDSHLRLPVYDHMDYMVVFSDQMKEQMIESVPEKKILVASSPKEERMQWLEEHRNEITLPDTWRERIGNKIVVFLNTSISSILTYGIRSIKKMEEVIRIFSKEQSVILLWRPHPLMRATLISMRPGLLERYDRLEAEFIDKQIGILDKTADANVAIAISDAYLGEPSSSIVTLFRSVGKPIFFTGIYPYYHWTIDELRSVSFRDAAFEEDKIWFITEGDARLCQMDLLEGDITVLGSIADEQPGSKRRYTEIAKIGDRLYMMPYYASGICVYDFETAHFRKYYMRDARPLGFHHMIPYGTALFLTPWHYPGLVRFDTVQKDFAYFGTELDWTQYTDLLWTDGESILLLHRDGRGLLRFWLKSCEIQILSQIDDSLPVEAVRWIKAIHAFNPDRFAASNLGGDAPVEPIGHSDRVIMETDNRNASDRIILDKGSKENSAFAGYLIGDKKVLAFPGRYGDIMEWDATTGEVSIAALNQRFDPYQKKPYFETGEDFIFVKPLNKMGATFESTDQTSDRSSDEAADGGFIAFSARRENTLYYRNQKAVPIIDERRKDSAFIENCVAVSDKIYYRNQKAAQDSIKKIPCRLSAHEVAENFKRLGEKEWTESDEVSVEQFLLYLKDREPKSQPAPYVESIGKGAGQEIHEMILKCL